MDSERGRAVFSDNRGEDDPTVSALCLVSTRIVLYEVVAVDDDL